MSASGQERPSADFEDQLSDEVLFLKVFLCAAKVSQSIRSREQWFDGAGQRVIADHGEIPPGALRTVLMP